MLVTGPAAGSERLKTGADATGTKVLGTVNNCAGGMTPWGTVMSGEENFHGYFGGELPTNHPEAASYERLGIPDGTYEWANFYDRFDVSKEPNEPNRFGWMIEIDPMDPNSVPKKRTALGRMKHEGAESIVAKDGRVVLYQEDDERFDYVYKFVQLGRYNDMAVMEELVQRIMKNKIPVAGQRAAGALLGWQAGSLNRDDEELLSAWKEFQSADLP